MWRLQKCHIMDSDVNDAEGSRHGERSEVGNSGHVYLTEDASVLPS